MFKANNNDKNTNGSLMFSTQLTVPNPALDLERGMSAVTLTDAPQSAAATKISEIYQKAINEQHQVFGKPKNMSAFIAPTANAAAGILEFVSDDTTNCETGAAEVSKAAIGTYSLALAAQTGATATQLWDYVASVRLIQKAQKGLLELALNDIKDCYYPDVDTNTAQAIEVRVEKPYTAEKLITILEKHKKLRVVLDVDYEFTLFYKELMSWNTARVLASTLPGIGSGIIQVVASAGAMEQPGTIGRLVLALVASVPLTTTVDTIQKLLDSTVITILKAHKAIFDNYYSQNIEQMELAHIEPLKPFMKGEDYDAIIKHFDDAKNAYIQRLNNRNPRPSLFNS